MQSTQLKEAIAAFTPIPHALTRRPGCNANALPVSASASRPPARLRPRKTHSHRTPSKTGRAGHLAWWEGGGGDRRVRGCRRQREGGGGSKGWRGARRISIANTPSLMNAHYRTDNRKFRPLPRCRNTLFFDLLFGGAGGAGRRELYILITLLRRDNEEESGRGERGGGRMHKGCTRDTTSVRDLRCGRVKCISYSELKKERKKKTYFP